MESTTGWARVKKLLGDKAALVVANVLQMPLPPKAYRRKTDKIDTGRILREFLNGSLPVAFQPSAWLRRIRRVVACRPEKSDIWHWCDAVARHGQILGSKPSMIQGRHAIICTAIRT